MPLTYMDQVRAIRSYGDHAVEQAYRMCADYSLLKLALDKTPVFGTIDYNNCRDVVMVWKWADDEYRASVRGIGYIEDQWKEFVVWAEKLNLKFVIPCDFERHPMPLPWTTDPPKVPGWYWIKPFPSGGAFILRAGEKQIAAGWYEKDDHTQYAGPIPEPGCDEGE